MNTDHLNAIWARVTAATPGPWDIRHRLNVVAGNRGIAQCGGYSSNQDSDAVYLENIANASFVAHSRQDVADLLTEVERLRAANARLVEACKEAIEWFEVYADEYPAHGRRVEAKLMAAVEQVENEAVE